MATIQENVQAGDDTYQLIAGYNAYITTLITRDCLLDMNQTGIDFYQPWWYAGYNDNVELLGKLFFCLGDASLSMWENLEVLFFNKKLLTDHSLTSPYQLVSADKWDFDTLRSYCLAVSADVNNDTSWDQTDTWGMLMYNKRDYPVYFENPYCTIGADGRPELTLFSERLADVYETIYQFYHVEHGCWQFAPDVNQQIFSEDRALFYQAPLRYAEIFRDNERDFGIVPFPKCNKGQARYYTTVLDKTSVFCIPASAKNIEFCGVILDALCRESSELVVPTYYDKALKDKYSRDKESTEMLDLVRQSVWFDTGFVYSASLNYLGAFMDALDGGQAGIASTFASKKPTYEAALNTLIEYLEQHDK